MKRIVEFSQLHGLRSFSRPVLALLLLALLLPVGTVPLAAAPLQTTMYQVYVTDVTAVSFVVTWTTETAGDGHVDWGPTTALGSTASDSVTSTTAHQVLVSGLSANADYYFQARSGTIIDNNGGNYYRVTTGSSAFPPTPGKTAYGYVYQQNGTTPVPNAVVYLQLQDNDSSGDSGNSQWVTARTNASGVWSYDLVNIRTADGSGYFTFSDGSDKLRLVRQGGDKGVVGEDDAQQIYSAPSAYPAKFDATLDAMPLGSPIVGHDHWGKSWSGTGTGLTLISSDGYGIYGQSKSSAGRGVYGYAAATSGNTTGVYGRSKSPNGEGVIGINTASTGVAHGVYAETSSTSGRAVQGWAWKTTGTNYGVLGRSSSNAGRGVYGYVSAGTGKTYGVYGQSKSSAGRGVFGYAAATSGNTTGVYGRSISPDGQGVIGINTASTGVAHGVYAETSSTSGRAVQGWAWKTTGTNYGVLGRSSSNAGRGVYGYVSAGTGTTYGVYGQSKSSAGRGVYGYAAATSGTNYGVYGRTGSSSGWAGYFYGGKGVYVVGDIDASGTKSAVVRTADGARRLYAEEAAEVWFADYGFGQLQKGVAVVRIDPVFAQTVSLQKPYHVFLEEYGPEELYVSQRTPGWFEVRAHKGKPDVEFSYRLVAKRLGFEDQRLAREPDADNDPNLYPERRAEWEARHGLPEPLPPEEVMEPLPLEEPPELPLPEELAEPLPPEETEPPVEGP